MSTTTVERYAGVDVSKARLDVAVRPTRERYSVANDPEGIEVSPTWRENEALLRTVPGVGPALARTLLAELPELWEPSPTSVSVPWWASPPSTAIPAV